VDKRLKLHISMKAYLALVLGMLFIGSSCQRHSDMQDEGADWFQGVWVQDSIPNSANMLNYTLHEFRVTCDSIYTTMKVHNKVKTMPDSCFKNGEWTEYAKAVYVLRGDSMIVEGVYTKPNWKQKISGCYKQGEYLPRYKVAYKSKDSVVLENKFDARPVILKKIKDITCVPKKRW